MNSAKSIPTPTRAILVSDFDGTMTGRDFFQIALERLLPADLPDYWQDYLSGRRTHFETLQIIYGAIRTSEAEVLAVLPLTELEPELAQWVDALQAEGWRIIVASAGCDWYIHALLQQRGVDVEVHANPGSFVPGQGLVMTLPTGSPFLSPTHGIDKAAIVGQTLRSGLPVAFAGDGYPDIHAALLVPSQLRFARAALAESLQSRGLPFQPFQHWSDVARALLH
jgi:2-hydroxy-3-keto-5-methylthiopentenyl-1-phosphate phosphatase